MSSTRSYLSSAKSRFKSYASRVEQQAQSLPRLLDPDDQNQGGTGAGLRAWIKEKSRGGFGLNSGNVNASTDIQVVNIFPGWAARRYSREGDTQVPPQFEIEVFVSGFACSRRDPESATPTRSQRAFLRLAKGFANMSKIVESTANIALYESSLTYLTPQTEQRLTLPNDTEDLDVEALDQKLNLATQDDSEDGDLSETSPIYTGPPSPQPEIPAGPHTDVLRRLQANLEQRIRYLWYTALPNRTVRLHFLISPHNAPAVGEKHDSSDSGALSLDPEHGFLAVQDVITGPDGSFQARLRVKWEDLCHHPPALHIAFGTIIEDRDLLVVAKLLPLSQTPAPGSTPQTPTSTPQTPIPTANILAAPLAAITRIPITHSPVHVISDIDDTVKLSEILLGSRAVFNNVFVKDLKDNVIPGMAEWYMKMFSQGVRFHYVSNGPFAMLPILDEFFRVSRLPSGSLKLKSYAGRSIFEGLLSAPATRKRAGVLAVLDAFPDSLFFLIGDTGEQDLELYADIARERPRQILGIFVRDARPATPTVPEPLSDPIGLNALDGLRPAERPSISVTQRSSPTGSLASLLKRFPSYRTKDSMWKTASMPSLGETNAVATASHTVEPTRFTVDSVSKSHTLSKEASHDPYYGFGPLTSQPEESSQSYFPTPAFTSPSSIGQQYADQVFITEPPKPIPSPSITSPKPSRPPAVSFSLKRAGTNSSASSSTVYENGENGMLGDQLQMRVYRARKLIPEHIVLRVFGDPSECVEVDEILRREGCAAHSN